MTINLKNKSLAEIQAMIAELTAVETAVKEQETAKAEALAKYENDKFAWAETCCKLLKGVTPASFEAVFAELPAKPAKPAILSTVKTVRTRTTTTPGTQTKAAIIAATAPAKYEDLVDAILAVYPETSESALKQNIVWYCKKGEDGIYRLK